ncbi:molybdate ABC transporter inner membrane subunit [Chondrocystis sp. NIES-4102]|nr:molybdate ABC transporter inner membrane subunit [Chondrocystis sp. NIES-4102]
MLDLDLSSIWISLKTAITATVITFFLGIMAAGWMLNYRGKGKEVIETLFTAPLVLPPTVVGFLLLLLLGKKGIIGQFLANIGVTIVFSWYATVIASTVVAFPLMYKTALGAFKQIDPNFFACARTLGASETRIFWQITLPLARQGIIAGTLLAFARALGEFGATLMLAGSIPGKTETIPIAIYLATEAGEMERASWLVIVMLVISFTVVMGVNYAEKIQFIGETGLNRFILPKNRKRTWDNMPVQHPIELTVEIQKQLPGFYLDVCFHTDQTPFGLLGASGAGKSLILRCIAGLEMPDRGKIILNGKVLFDSQKAINLPPQERNCGFLFQNYALFPHLTVAENIAFGMPSGKTSQAIKEEIAQQLIAVNLAAIGDRYPRQLSGGQQQRVALARARASKPEIMLLDEPFSALDTYLRDKQEKILRNNLIHYQGVTLLITHNLEEAYRVCPNLMVIDQGRAIAIGSKQDIFKHPGNYRTAQLTGCKNFSRAIAINDHQILAVDWYCTLEVIPPIPPTLKYVGIRAYQLDILGIKQAANTFNCWLANQSETQHRMTLYLKLNQAPKHREDYHLQAEVYKDRWEKLKCLPSPWKIQLQPQKIMFLS